MSTEFLIDPGGNIEITLLDREGKSLPGERVAVTLKGKTRASSIYRRQTTNEEGKAPWPHYLTKFTHRAKSRR